MRSLLRWLFVCQCTRLSFPITRRGKALPDAAMVTGTYVVCLDCGSEYPYDWKTMRTVSVPKSKKVRRQLLPLINADER